MSAIETGSGDGIKHNVFILNPIAGRSKNMRFIAQNADMLFGDDVDFIVTKERDDYYDAVRRYGESGEDIRIFVCGGDGTLNSVLQVAVGYPNLSVTNYACGTGNDFLKHFDDPSVFRDLRNYSDIGESEFDIIRVNDRYSANVMCFGMDARICLTYERIRFMNFIGKYGYKLSCIYNIFKGISQSCRVEFDDGHVFDGPMTFVCVCNNGWYGGSFNPVPEASLTDGYLDVIICKKVSLFQMLRYLPKYKRGRQKDIPERMMEYRRCRSLKITSPEEAPFNLDGETYMCREAEISVESGKMRFFYPRSAYRDGPSKKKD